MPNRQDLHRLIDALPDEALGPVHALVGKLLERARQASTPVTGPAVYQLKIQLLDVKPPVWRRVRVSGDTTLAGLHDVIQAAMGWEDYHLHEFTIGRTRYVPAADREDSPNSLKDEAEHRLDQVLQVGARIGYTYDFGDDWEHRITVEKVVAPEANRRYPTVVAGKGACPPEDSGGPWGYLEKLAVMRTPEDDEHEEVVAWVGKDFDPTRFDLIEATAAVEALAPRAGGRKKRR